MDNKIYKDLIKERKSTLKNVLVTKMHLDYIGGHAGFDVKVVIGSIFDKKE